MNPFQHGEVYVLNDGTETDLDLGHYERFTNVKLTKLNNLTSGRVYLNVLERERQGGYLGKTVQVIPYHATKSRNASKLLADTSKADVLITEIGGTTGDIEGLPFLEAIREFALEQGYKQRDLHPRHLRPLHQGRRRTQDQAHPAVRRQLRGNRHHPQIPRLPLRPSLAKDVRQKISLFCNVPYEAVIESATSSSSIYESPAHGCSASAWTISSASSSASTSPRPT